MKKCKVCKKIITKKSILGYCRPCSNKFAHKRRKKYFCKCGKEIHYDTRKYGGGQCSFCANKGQNHPLFGKSNKWGHHTKETKKHLSLMQGGTGIPHAHREHPKEFFYIRDSIRERDNYICQICNCKESEINRELDIHHIDYNKFNSDKKNLIGLCNHCHPKTNTNRDYWYSYFTYIMENR